MVQRGGEAAILLDRDRRHRLRDDDALFDAAFEAAEDRRAVIGPGLGTVNDGASRRAVAIELAVVPAAEAGGGAEARRGAGARNWSPVPGTSGTGRGPKSGAVPVSSGPAGAGRADGVVASAVLSKLHGDSAPSSCGASVSVAQAFCVAGAPEAGVRERRRASSIRLI